MKQNNTKQEETRNKNETEQCILDDLAFPGWKRCVSSAVQNLVTKPDEACCENAVIISSCPQPDTPAAFRSLNHTLVHLPSALEVWLRSL